MTDRKYFLKMIGAAGNELADDWLTTDPHLLKEVRSNHRPSGISRGDLLVYYATGKQQIFGIVKAKGDGVDAELNATRGEEKWPYVMPIQSFLVIPDLRLAPDWDVMGIKPQSIMRKSYIEITRSQYHKAWVALTDRTRLKDQPK